MAHLVPYHPLCANMTRLCILFLQLNPWVASATTDLYNGADKVECPSILTTCSAMPILLTVRLVLGFVSASLLQHLRSQISSYTDVHVGHLHRCIS